MAEITLPTGSIMVIMVAVIITATIATEITMAIIMAVEIVITGTGTMGITIMTGQATIIPDQVITILVEDQVMTATGIIHPVTGTMVIPTAVVA